MVVGMKFENFRIFFGFFGALTVKTASFSVQMIEFVFNQSDFNLNGPIMSRHITTAHRPQRQEVVRTVPSDATARPGQAPVPPPGPAVTSSMAGGSTRWPNSSA
jgi:hypothetical protein